MDGAPLGGSCSQDGESVEKCLQPTLPKCVDRNTYCTPPPLNKMNDDGSINSFMKIEFDQEPNYPYVPNTMIKYWCSGILLKLCQWVEIRVLQSHTKGITKLQAPSEKRVLT